MFQQNVIVLDDNYPAEKYAYIVNVHTGNRFNAGTTSKAAIQLYGLDNRSRVSRPHKKYVWYDVMCIVSNHKYNYLILLYCSILS